MPVHVKKVSVALGHDELEWAQRRAKRDGTSVSAVLTAATRRAREDEARDERQRAAWEEYEAWAAAECGPLSPADLDAARGALDAEPPRGTRRAKPRRARRPR
jgi:Arc/MetJ-type ribon-helix-helix transcriptional regulator